MRFSLRYNKHFFSAAGNQDSGEQVEPENDGICATSEWGQWSECSTTCGVGFISRSRNFRNRMGRKKCPHIETRMYHFYI